MVRGPHFLREAQAAISLASGLQTPDLFLSTSLKFIRRISGEPFFSFLLLSARPPGSSYFAAYAFRVWRSCLRDGCRRVILIMLHDLITRTSGILYISLRDVEVLR